MGRQSGHVYLIGIMGCGKTSVGRLLAKEINRPFIDLDRWIVEKEGRSVNEIFADEGEEYFRELERKHLNRLSRKKGRLVIATGGGAVLREENLRCMRQSGTVIWLDRPIEEIVAQLDASSRPLLKDGADVLYDIYAKRKPLYQNAAHIHFENRYFNARRAAQQLSKRVGKKEIVQSGTASHAKKKTITSSVENNKKNTAHKKNTHPGNQKRLRQNKQKRKA